MIGKGGITWYHMVLVSYGHRMGMVWYEWAAKECISMSDNQRFGSAGWAEQGAEQGRAGGRARQSKGQSKGQCKAVQPFWTKLGSGPRDGGKKEIH